MTEPDDDIKLMNADIANKEADRIYTRGLLVYEAGKGGLAGGADLLAALLGCLNRVRPAPPASQQPMFPPGKVITIPAAGK